MGDGRRPRRFPGVPEPDPGDLNATYAATLVDEWARSGLSDAVVCPGSRSTPLAVALADHPRVAVHVHHDERSGAFVALGLGLATGRPAVLLTTSGTAAVELHPAVVEAHQAAVPLIAVTADRPPELRDRRAPQTIDQRQLYGPAVRAYLEAAPPEWGSADRWRDLAREAWSIARGDVLGPVHLNVAFAEPLVGKALDLPPSTGDPSPAASPALQSPRLSPVEVADLAAIFAGHKGVIVCGGRSAVDHRDRSALAGLARRLGWPILADHLSGMRGDDPLVIGPADPMLRHAATAESLRPEAVLRVGGLPASRVLNEWLAASGATQVGLDRYGWCPDPDGVLGRSLRADVGEAASQLHRALDPVGGGAAPVTSGEWLRRWQRAAAASEAAISEVLAQEPLFEPAVVAAALGAVPWGGAMVVSSSMPVRDLEWYGPPVPEGVRVLANRGANGIDGVTSTAVGVALSGMPTVALLGDVAFLHDTNGLLGLARREVDLLVVVIDNDGGGIFSFLPQATVLREDRFEQLFGTPHGVDLLALARAHGVTADRIAGRGELDAAFDAWVRDGGTRVVVVPSDRAANRELHARLNDAVAAALDRGANAPIL